MLEVHLKILLEVYCPVPGPRLTSSQPFSHMIGNDRLITIIWRIIEQLIAPQDPNLSREQRYISEICI